MGFSTLAGFVIVLMVSITIAGYLLHAVIDQIKEITSFRNLRTR